MGQLDITRRELLSGQVRLRGRPTRTAVTRIQLAPNDVVPRYPSQRALTDDCRADEGISVTTMAILDARVIRSRKH